MRKIKCLITSMLMCTTFLAGCTNQTTTTVMGQVIPEEVHYKGIDFDYQVNPENFELIFKKDEERLVASLPFETKEVSDFKEEEGQISWRYPNEAIEVKLEKEDNYLSVEIVSTKEEKNAFTWPSIKGESYILPFREGKWIPKDDPYWKVYLDGMEMIEALSMRFFAVNHERYSVLYIMEDLFESRLEFDTKEAITFKLKHEFTTLEKAPSYKFRIYVTETNPVPIAKIYRNYIIEQGEFKSLKEKAKDNANIEKLYGAVHMYLWDTAVLSEVNVKWQAFRSLIDSEVMNWIRRLLPSIDGGQEALNVLEEIKSQDYVSNYQKNVILQALNKLLVSADFYNKEIFKQTNEVIEALLEKGINNLNEMEQIRLNKEVLQANLPTVFEKTEEWANDKTTDILKEMKEAGIGKAWIGLDNWIQAFIKPELVTYAVDAGYLIGPYDSYHSIHKPGKEQWHTATFTDQTLYEEATIQAEDGTYESGFQGVGRKLNPTLSMPSVKARVDQLLDAGIPFNAWFVDCDATGEIYNDYTPEHLTTKEEDLKARLSRMAYIRDAHQMVIGSEGGNDFASQDIALAHGIELPSFAWMDQDMKKNKDSEYYLGRYYAPKGGVPEKFAKPVPVKAFYKKIFLDMTYNIPLFKLVYNDSVITTYHWDWSTFKIKDEVETRMLYEILYNVPPLYHIDRNEWELYKEDIVTHSDVYERFSIEAVQQEMTDFKVLSEDRLVQMTTYGKDLKVIANFSNQVFNYEGNEILPQALIIDRAGEKEIYKK